MDEESMAKCHDSIEIQCRKENVVPNLATIFADYTGTSSGGKADNCKR